MPEHPVVVVSSSLTTHNVFTLSAVIDLQSGTVTIEVPGLGDTMFALQEVASVDRSPQRVPDTAWHNGAPDPPREFGIFVSRERDDGARCLFVRVHDRSQGSIGWRWLITLVFRRTDEGTWAFRFEAYHADHWYFGLRSAS